MTMKDTAKTTTTTTTTTTTPAKITTLYTNSIAMSASFSCVFYFGQFLCFARQAFADVYIAATKVLCGYFL